MNFLRKIDIFLLFLTAITGIVISIIDFFDLFSLNDYFQQNINYSTVCLVFLAVIGAHLALRFLNEEDHKELIVRKLDSLISTSNNIQVKIFDDSAELEVYLARRIREAKHEICDLTWKLVISADFSLDKRKDSHSIYEKAVESITNKLIYREVWVFNDKRRVDKFNKRMSENKAGYSCRYYRNDTSKIPRLQFVIIDNEEVIFFATAKNALRCSIKGEAICNVCKPYFEEVWSNAIEIKEGERVIQEELAFINKNYGDGKGLAKANEHKNQKHK